MQRPVKITRDSGANVKVLRKLELEELIMCTDVLLENGRENKKIKKKEKPAGVWSLTRWGESVWAGEVSRYDTIVRIIGKNSAADALHLDTHLRIQNEFFVTEDTDFLKKREELETEFSCRIVTPNELVELLRKV